MSRPLLLASALALVATTAGAAAPRTGSDTRLPLPRYESIATAEAWGRRGPGGDHRIDWVYRARGLPVQVLEESGPWRRVRDPAGDTVWLHASRLSPNRTVLVSAEERPGVPLRAAPRPEAQVVAYLGKGVVGALTECVGGWRKVTIADRASGWAAADGLWAGEDCKLPE